MEKLTMKTIGVVLTAGIMASAVLSCGEQKKSNNIIAQKPVAKAPASPVKMQDSNHKETVEWLGGQYVISISRRADTSLPMVRDDTGGRYYDNRISVKITRSDGSLFFEKTFTKDDFASNVDEEYLEKSALLGIVIDSADDSGLVLAASIGSPDVLSDDYLPLLITVSRTGGISVKRDSRLDGGESDL